MIVNLRYPKLPPRAGLEPVGLDFLEAEATLEKASVINIDASELRANNLTFDESYLERLVLVEAKCEKLSLTDCALKNCDFSAANCSDSSFIRVNIFGGRMSGLDLNKSTLQDVVFENCKLDMANFRFAKLHRVRFINCIMVETDFQVAELNGIEFQNCQLEKVEFSQCKIRNIDARSSQLIDIRGWQSLRGLTIDNTQTIAVAQQLANELGLIVK